MLQLSTQLYGGQATVKKNEIPLKACEMWLLGRMLRISRAQKVNNEEVVIRKAQGEKTKIIMIMNMIENSDN